MKVELSYVECQTLLKALDSEAPGPLRYKLRAVEPENEFLLQVKDELLSVDETVYEEVLEDDCYGWHVDRSTSEVRGDDLVVSVLWAHEDDRGGNESFTVTVSVLEDGSVTVDRDPVEKDVQAVVRALLEATFFNGGG